MTIAQANPFVSRQFGQTHRATGMEFLRTDGHLSPQPKLPAVVETSAGVDKHSRRVDLVDEAGGVVPVVGEDGVGMFGAVLVDVINGFAQPGNNFDAEDEGQPFLVEIVRASG